MVLQLQETIGFSSWIILLIGVLLLVVSGFMSSSEVAFFSLKPQDIEDIKCSNDQKDKDLYKLLGKSEHLLATILIGNNFVNIAIVILLSVALNNIFHLSNNSTLSFLIETVFLTLLLLLFGEIIPKVYAQGRPLSFSRFAVGKMSVLVRILYPFSSVLVGSTKIVTKRMQRKKYDISVDDLSQAVGLLEDNNAEEKAMFAEIINFYSKTANEIMTPRMDMVAVDIESPFDIILKQILESGYSRIPVYEDSQDNIKGILYLKDLIPYRRKEADFQWQNLIRKAYFVPENKRIDDLLEECRSNKVHMSIVVDEYGGTSGIITLEDILEEIVGEISDEYDDEQLPFRKMNDGSYIFEAKTPIVDVLRYLSIENGTFGEYEEAADTLGGLVIEIKQDIPKKGDIVTIEDWKFVVLDIERFRILKVQIFPPNN